MKLYSGDLLLKSYRIQLGRFAHGAKGPVTRTEMSLRPDRDMDLAITFSPRVIQTSVLIGRQWRILDTIVDESAGLLGGRFGFFVPEGTQLVLSSFQLTPQ